MKLYVKSLFLSITLLILSGCGGGGTITQDTSPTPPGGGGSTPPVTLSISLSIADAEGNENNLLDANTPLTITAVVTDSEGNPVDDELVTFTFSQDNLATFNNDAGTALTNEQGVATIGIVVGQDSGDGLVFGTVGTDTTAQVGFSSSGTSQVVVQPFSVELFGSITQLSSSGSDEVELTALVKNEQNVLLQNVEVRFRADSNASIAVTQPLTDENGIARAILRTLNQPENRIITATAEVLTQTQTLERSIEIPVVGTEINVNGPTSVIVNDDAPITLSLEDSDKNGIPGETITLTVLDANGTEVQGLLNDQSPTTGNNGQISVNFNSNASGQFTINATALSASGTLSLFVQQDQFGFVGAPDVDNADDDIPLNTNQSLTIQWLKDGSAFANGTVAFNSSRGTISNADAVTDADGNASFDIQSDNAGLASITALGVDNDGNEVSARINISFVATVASSIFVDATPDSIGPDGQTSTISAVVRDPTGNLVKNKVVTFEVEDVSNGDITTDRSTTDRRGIASTVYRSNAVSSVDSVRVHATVEDTPAVTSFTTLTVGDRAFDISIGTGRLIDSPTDSSYAKEFSVFVTDPDSNPVVNANLTFSAPAVKFSQGGVFRKGYWIWDPVAEVWDNIVTAICPNEDINDNGILDAGEDTNGDGQLTPGNVVSVPSSAQTDQNGQALIEVQYARQFGAWADISLKVSGESDGSESSETQIYTLGVAAADLIDDASPPPNSPYGLGPNCNDTI